MEPANLNSTPPEDDRLRTLLGTAHPPLPDKGFTQRVLAALPPPTQPPSTFVRPLLCAVGAAAGLALAIDRGPSLHTLSTEFERLRESWANSALPLAADPGGQLGAALAVAFAATALSLFYVFRGSFRPPLRSSV